jgi:hypothetical protein
VPESFRHHVPGCGTGSARIGTMLYYSCRQSVPQQQHPEVAKWWFLLQFFLVRGCANDSQGSLRHILVNLLGNCIACTVVAVGSWYRQIMERGRNGLSHLWDLVSSDRFPYGIRPSGPENVMARDSEYKPAGIIITTCLAN